MVATADGASVVVKAEVVLGDQRTAVEIAISTELAPQVAMALLATIATSRGDRDGLAPALDVLAAAVIASSRAKRVRMHLLFEKGAVLPLEISLDAALALERGLAAELKSVLNAPEPEYCAHGLCGILQSEVLQAWPSVLQFFPVDA